MKIALLGIQQGAVSLPRGRWPQVSEKTASTTSTATAVDDDDVDDDVVDDHDDTQQLYTNTCLSFCSCFQTELPTRRRRSPQAQSQEAVSAQRVDPPHGLNRLADQAPVEIDCFHIFSWIEMD